MIPEIRTLRLRDTVFENLMQRRIYNILLVATRYDSFILEDDGRVDEQIYNEYSALGLSSPPRITQVATVDEALRMLSTRRFDLIILMPNMGRSDALKGADILRNAAPGRPVVLLTPFSKEVSKRLHAAHINPSNYVFSWLGDTSLIIAIIKLIEDGLNVAADTDQADIQIILLVEDSVRFYSSVLTHLYGFVLEQSQEFAAEALNEHQMHLRMRGRPKILLARSYEEAESVFRRYGDHIMGIVSDMSISREGKKDDTAGYRFGRLVRESGRKIPFILESSDPANVHYADLLGARFIAKGQRDFPQVLRQSVKELFGFGDFVIRDPLSGNELLRIRDLKDLQLKVRDIPDEALQAHLDHDDFSRFFFSRAMFTPARILQRIDLSEWRDMEQARTFIYNLIVAYRQMKNQGTIAVYNRDRFDELSRFARMGNGSLGGKGRGLAFIGSMLRRNPCFLSVRSETPGSHPLNVSIPRTVVICTDIFDKFMEQNHLLQLALSNAPDSDIFQAFVEASLPDEILDNLKALLRVMHGPLAVRSSGLLEDAHYQPFAGVYSTYMVPYSTDPVQRLEGVRSAIKAVYASTFFQASKNYMTATQNVIDQEKMAIVIQETVGRQYAGRFYPTISGVARSLNFYPIGDEQPHDGIVSLALGLGKYIVDGGPSLRFSPRHSHKILQLSEVKTALRSTQTYFYALDTTGTSQPITLNDGFNLVRCPVAEADKDGTLPLIASTYDSQSDILRDGCYPEGRKILSFAGILKHGVFPLAEALDGLLRLGAQEMDRPIEIEFAVDIEPNLTEATLYLLQIRPTVDLTQTTPIDILTVSPEHILLSSPKVLGHGTVTDVADIVYVPQATFSRLNTPAIAAQIASINKSLQAQGRSYMLVGPGRWGSSDPHLGIPVRWPDIAGAAVICECGLPDYRVEPSQGTHFFQNLTSLGVGYFTVNPYKDEGTFDEAWLNALPAEVETDLCRLVHLPAPLTIQMDGLHSSGVVLKP